MKNKKDRVLFLGDTDAESNYVKKVLERVQGRLKPGVSITDVLHDDWCAMLNGGDRCNCNPEIRIREIKKP